MSDDPKPLRDLLLARHVHATPALDALRTNALSGESVAGELRTLADYFFGPDRRLWTAIAATWTILLLLHLTVARTSPPANQTMPPPALIAECLAQLNAHETVFAQYDRRR